MKIPASRSPEQLTAILEALATVRPLAMSSMDTQLGATPASYLWGQPSCWSRPSSPLDW